MPCVNSSNGKPVPGIQGQCPIGSTWIPDSDAFSSSVYQGEDDKPLQNVGDWFSPGGVLKAGAGLALASPFIKGGINYAKKKATDPNNLKRLQALKNKLFKRFDKPERPKYPIMNKNQQAAWDKANPGKWLYDKWKLTGWGGGTGLSLMQLMEQMGDGGATEGTEEAKSSGPPTRNSRAKALSDADAQHGARFGMTSEPTQMQKLGANMKNPEWWSESISGLPSDTRLMRLGQLMNYYGKTPKQRDEATAPAELWAANEIAHGKNVATAAGGSNSTFLSKFNSEDQDLAIRKSVMDTLGFNDYVPFNQAGSQELEQTVARVKGLIQEFVEKGMPWSDALTLAMSYVEKE